MMADETEPVPDIPKATPTQRRSQDAHARRHSRYEEAVQLRSAGTLDCRHRRITRRGAQDDPTLVESRTGSGVGDAFSHQHFGALSCLS